MSDNKRLSDTIIEMGDDWQPDCMEDWDERSETEFKDLSMEQIRNIYLEEAIADEEAEDEAERLREEDERDDNEDD